LESPETTGNSIGISGSIEIHVLESFRSKRSSLRIISRLKELNINIIGGIDIILNGDIGR